MVDAAMAVAPLLCLLTTLLLAKIALTAPLFPPTNGQVWHITKDSLKEGTKSSFQVQPDEPVEARRGEKRREERKKLRLRQKRSAGSTPAPHGSTPAPNGSLIAKGWS